ncbi:hypothetical protein [Echinicola sp. 20G]|uniref:hypothetical protein n=1 Tax=Echinicola sp. 20G TaxID=2781961 RepID=UPI0019104FB1|nr:hypothetical protein [Echinicola sp. 20G]
MKAYPFIKELAMEAYLIENEEILKLDNRNFSEVDVLDAEIALKSGRKSADGRIDILAKYGAEYLGIVELKLKEINNHSLSQLEDYLNVKEQILSFGDYWDEEGYPKWVGVLIGDSISPQLQELLANGYEYKGIPIAGMTIRRFRSEANEIFVISDTFFKFNYTSKDFSKFHFNGESYNKGRLVNAVMKYYVELHPYITYAELKRDFPDWIQGSFGVFETFEKAEDIFLNSGHKRYYINPEETIRLNDKVISTCTQWRPDNIQKFIERSNEYGLNIEVN